MVGPDASSDRARIAELEAENARLRRQCETERTQWDAFFTNALEGLIFADDQHRIFAVNPAAEHMLGLSADEIMRRGTLRLADPQDHERWQLAVDERAATGQFRGELTFRRRDGSTFPAEVSSTIFQVDSTAQSCIIFRDVSEQRALREELQARADTTAQLAMVDELTGLANRRAFMDALERRIQAAERDRTPFTVIVADLDHLKEINDEHGHAVGDLALRAAADALRRAFRRADLVARLSGDEFVAMLEDRADACQEADLAGRVADAAVAASWDLGLPFEIGISLGCSVYDPAQPMTLGRLLAEADAAMYDVKRSRR